MTELLNCIVFAADKHKHQRRKNDGSSYICHPLRVAQVLTEIGLDPYEYPHTFKSAVLHDTIEDVGVTKEEIAEKFGEVIANVVMELTDDKSLSKLERKKKQVENAPKKSICATLVKLADKIDNLRSFKNSSVPEGWSQDRVAGYHRWCFEVVRNLPEHLGYVEADAIQNLKEICFKLCEPYKDFDLESYYKQMEICEETD